MTAPRPTYWPAYVHTANNLRHRYGMEQFGLTEYEALCYRIADTVTHDKHPCILAKQHAGRLILRWKIGGTATRLVWCPRARLVITALPTGTLRADASEDRFTRQQARRRKAYRRSRDRREYL